MINTFELQRIPPLKKTNLLIKEKYIKKKEFFKLKNFFKKKNPSKIYIE